jgi:hypothetical protein
VQRLKRSLRGQGKWALLSSIALALIIAPFAVAGDGDVMRVGAGNSAENNETRIIGQNVSTYATRQSNNKEGDGGSATYGCRANIGAEPCIFVNALRTTRAFDFRSHGIEGGRILVYGDKTNPDNNKPFTTNATGVATGLNADEVDGRSAASLVARFAAVNANGTFAAGNGATSSSRVSEGTYDVNFTAPITGCAYTATITDYINAGATGVQPQDADTIRVRTRAGGGLDDTGPTAVSDRPFHLVVNCP